MKKNRFMKPFYHRILLIVILCLYVVNVSASVGKIGDAKIDGIYYNFWIDSETNVTHASVTHGGSYSRNGHDQYFYSGSIHIPETVTYNGKTYNVTKIDGDAFYHCVNVTSVVLPNSIESIGDCSFAGCKGLTSLTLPSNLKRIDSEAFNSCSGLTTITVPVSVTSIGSGAFINCSKLSTINLPPDLTDIGSGAFHGTAWYNSLYNSLPDGLVYIGKVAYAYKGTMPSNTSVNIKEGTVAITGYLFDNQSNLVSVTIPTSLTTIGEYAFSDCNGLTSITIPSSVMYIGRGAFIGCDGLTSITIPSSVTFMGGEAFEYCSGLTSVTINYGLTIIRPGAFALCYNLASVNIPSSVTTIYDNAFDGCRSLTSVTLPASVTSIGDEAFGWCTSLTSITIPSSVTTIGDGAFSGCSSLTSVTVMMKDPIEIEEYTFDNRYNAILYVPYGCKASYEATDYWKDFKEIIEISPIIEFADVNVKALCVTNWDTNDDGELSEAEAAAVADLGEVFKGKTNITSFKELQYFTGLEVIGEMAFGGCSGMTSVTIPNSVTSIDDYAFCDCSSLTSVTIPNSVTSISNRAFEYCFGLNEISVASGNSQYDSRNGCDAIIETSSNTLIIGCKNSIIPNSVSSIGPGAFFSCYGLTNITIPNSVTSIGSSAFAYCSGLTNVIIGNSVSIIDNYAFRGCSNLTSVTIPNYVTNIGYAAFRNCSSLKSVTIGSSVLIIGGSAFRGCPSLTSVTIPNSVTEIVNGAFAECSGLASVTIGNSVTSIGYGAFYDCSSLTSVTVEMEIPVAIGESVFPNRTNATLYVPHGCSEAYETAPYWQDFNVVEMPAPASSIRVFVEETSLRTGSQAVIPVLFENEEAYGGLQCEVTLPAGITLSKVTKTDRLSDDFVLQKSKSGENTYQILLYNTNRLSFTGNDGALFTMTVDVDDNMSVGDYTMTFSDIVATDVDENQEDLADVSVPLHVEKYLIGDVNRDNRVNVTDIMAVANYILKNPSSNFNAKAADVNNDNRINVTDIMGIANIILKVNPAQSAPRIQTHEPQ